MKTHAKDKPQNEETKTQNNQEEAAKLQETSLEIAEEEKKEDKDVTAEAEINQDGQIVIQDAGAQKRFKCGLCVKSYTYLHSLKKHMLSHVQMCVFSPDGSERMYAFKQQQQQEQEMQQQQVQQVVVGGVGGVQQLAVPVHQHVQPLVPQVHTQYTYTCHLYGIQNKKSILNHTGWFLPIPLCVIQTNERCFNIVIRIALIKIYTSDVTSTSHSQTKSEIIFVLKQNNQHYPVISSVQLQQTHQQVNTVSNTL